MKTLSKLEVLNLNGTRIRAEGLESITEIKSLKSVYLWNTAVNPEDKGVKEMALAKVKVVFGS